ncbi:unnamed protein product [Diamesa serratosioi]
MGIKGLIPFVEKATSQINISELRGKVVAIDSYCWLHKGAYACAEQLVQGNKNERRHIDYCLKYINMLLSFNIKPILVFDGRNVPAKAETESKRRESRKDARKKAGEFLRAGKTTEARSQFNRCVDITHEMALELIRECRRRNVDCVVGPYEADAQLCYLNKIGIAEYIITEDSDLILFGCKKVLFKLQLTGSCLLLEADKLHLAMNCSIEKYSLEKFRHMCIISGCDYIDSLPGIGLAKACKFVMMTEETDISKSLLKMPSYLNMKQLAVTNEYIEGVLKAEATFKYMYVYDPLVRKTVRLTTMTDEMDLKYCTNAGEPLDNATAFQMALGNINPKNLNKLDTYNPDNSPDPLKEVKKSGSKILISKYISIWKNFNPLTDCSNQVKTQQTMTAYLGTSNMIQDSAEMQNIIRRENDTTDNVEIEDLITAYNSPVIRTKRKNSELDNDFNDESNNVRNPFVKKRTSMKWNDEEENDNKSLSETSLIKNVPMIISPTSVNKFKRTPNPKHNIRSKFFEKVQIKVETKEVKEVDMEVDKISAMKLEYEERLFERNAIYEKSPEPESESPKDVQESEDEETMSQDLTIEDKSSIVDLDKYQFKKKTHEHNFLKNILPKNIISKPIAKSRKPAIFKPKPSDGSTIQTRLSAFGFQKK